MIISRSLVRQFRRVLRRAGIKSTPRNTGPRVRFQTGLQGLSIRAYSAITAIEYRQPGEMPVSVFDIPLALLAECEAKDSSLVTSETSTGGQTTLTWSSRGVQQVRTLEAAVTTTNDWEFPPSPEAFVQNPPGVFKALAAAADICACESSRYALNCVQLRGAAGRISATDGHQLFVQSGYKFPWTGDVLIPRPLVLGSPELPHDLSVEIGHAKNWLSLVSGPWTIYFSIQKEGRFPKVESNVPSVAAMPSRLELSEQDAQLLANSLPQLPGAHDDFRPIEVDLNGQVLIRAQDKSQSQASDLALTSSKLHGQPIRFCTNRQFLARAISLGFRDFYFCSPVAPALCNDRKRQYVWMLLGEPDRRRSCANTNIATIRDESPAGDSTESDSVSSNEHVSQSINVRKAEPVSQNANDETQLSEAQAQKTSPSAATGNLSSIDRAIVLRDSLRDSLAKTNELIQHLRLHQRQSKLVASTIESLKQLQTAG